MSTHSSVRREAALEKLRASNCTAFGHLSLRTLLIRARASLDPRPLEVQMFNRLYNTALTQVRPTEMPPKYSEL